jgi:hypothetical protein
MRVVVRHAERGQALVETTIAIGGFLLALYAIIWVAQTAVIAGRLQLGVRYGSVITSEISPYVDYSLYAVYNSVGSPSLPAYTCTPAPAGILSGTQPLPGPTAAPFWQPTASSVSAACTMTLGTYSQYTLNRPFLIEQSQQTFSASQPVPHYLAAALGASTAMSASARAFRTPDVATVAYCFPALATAVHRSLVHDDASVSGEAAPTPIPAQPAGNGTALSEQCQ